MGKYTCADDVYADLVGDSREGWLTRLLTFAIVEEQRIEWVRHHVETTGSAPTAIDVQRWYESQPLGTVLRAETLAGGLLEGFSEDVVSRYADTLSKHIENGVVIAEIRRGRKFWTQVGVSMVGGLASSFVFAFLLIVVTWLVFNDRSPVDFGVDLT